MYDLLRMKMILREKEYKLSCASHTRDMPRDQKIKIKEIGKLVANLLCEGKQIRALLTRIAQRGLSVYNVPFNSFLFNKIINTNHFPTLTR